MRNEQKRHADFALQLFEQGKNLCLHRHIKRGGRLIANQQLGSTRQRHRNHRPLALTAGELMREKIDALVGRRNTGARQKLNGARTGELFFHALVQHQYFSDLMTDGVQRV